MRKLLVSNLLATLFLITHAVGQYAADIAAIEALGTDPAMLSAPAVYGFPANPHTPVNQVNNAVEMAALPTSVLLDASGASPITLAAGDRQYIYFDGKDYLGNPTRVLGCLRIPAGASAAAPVPAVVCIHGGGGSAAPVWANKWHNEGYAVLVIAVEGQVYRKDTAFPQMNTNWNAHNMAGPVRDGIYSATKNAPIPAIGDQWMYHACAAAIRANSLLRDLPFVDSNKVGMMGISWGGVITSTVMGIDNRLAFAIPVYGCGHMFDASSPWGNTSNLGNHPYYEQVWDPMLRLSNATMPSLWLSWPRDQFPMDCFSYSYHKTSGTRMVSLIHELGHGEAQPRNVTDSYDFADSVVNGSGPWCVEQSSSLSGNTATVVFQATEPLSNVSLLTTTDDIAYDAAWNSTQAWPIPGVTTVSMVEAPAGTWTVTATLPANTQAYYVNVENAGGSVASSDFQEVNEIVLSPLPELAFTHPGDTSSMSGTVSVALNGPATVPVTSVAITGQSHAGAFSIPAFVPFDIDGRSATTTDYTVTFNNAVAGLTAGQMATATFTVTWEEPDGSTKVSQLPLKATVPGTGPTTVIYSATALWSSQTVNCADNVIIHNNATVVLDASAGLTPCANNIYVNDDPAPNTGGLIINPGVTLTVGGGIYMGTDTGAGYVTQSDGSVTTPLLEVNSSLTGVASVYRLTGGDLNFVGNGGLDVALGSSMIIDGGTVYKDLTVESPMGALGDFSSDGLIQVTGGGLQITGGVVTSVLDQSSPIEVSGGDVDLIGQLRVYDDFKVIGDTADITVGWLNGLTGSHFDFEMGANGVSPIKVNSWANLGASMISVDGSNYTGGPGTHLLIGTNNLASSANAANINVSGFAAQGLIATVVQDTATNDVYLELTEDAYNSWATANALTGADRDPSADPDGDGRHNLYEYAFDSDPNVAGGGQAPKCFDGTTFSVTLREASAAGLVYTLQESADLIGWGTVTGTTSAVTPLGGGMETIDYTKAGGWNTGDKYFLRVKVEVAP